VPAAASLLDRDKKALIAAACAPGLIWICDRDQQFEWFNPAWESFTGKSHEELSGSGWLALIHPEDVERCKGVLAASFQARQAYTLDYRLRRHDGEFRWFLDTGVPRFEANGVWAGYVGTGIEIEERKQAEEQLAERARTLRLAERRQGSFLAMLSHELRNPLAPIANAASVLRTIEDSNPVLVRLREILERQVDRVEKLVENLVDATRSAQGQISLVSEPIRVDAVVRGAVEKSADIVARSGHTLDVKVSEERLCVKGDLSRLSQALSNLIANAAQFSDPAAAISLGVRAFADRIEISVRDRGQGMTPDFLPHAFELFAQEEQTAGRRPRGLGIGLTLARRIVQLHNGSIQAHSEGHGMGTCVVVTLPRLQDLEAADEAAAAAPLSDRYRVLIIEGDPDAREALRRQMEMWGNEVRLAADSREGLATTDSFRPHIVMCDIGLPGLEQFDLLKLPRLGRDGHRTLFAAITDRDRIDEEARALAAGYDSLLIKPLEADSLARLLRSYANAVPAAQ
jgi:PAS domain S-box-containing protein